MTTPVLETERLILRPIRREDAAAIQQWFSNWNIIRNLTKKVPWPYPDDGAATFLTETVLPAVKAGASLVWAITERNGADELVGMIDYSFESTGLGNRGFWLAEHLWGRGYMTEAVIAMQDHVLLDLGVERMVVLNSTDNPGSRRIKEKTGAQHFGQTSVEHHSGETVTDQWEITRQAWAEMREHS